MPFVPELPKYNKDETALRTGADYVKFTEDYRVTLRILDKESRMVWKHYIQQANSGKGTSVVCPNITAQTNACPIEQSVMHLPKDNQERKNAWARRRFIANVLDRTPYTTCQTCNTATPGNKCVNCGASLKNHDFAPLNKVKILEGGPKLFVDNLAAIDKMQREDLGKEITEYDITFTANGTGRDKRVSALPRDAAPLEEDALLNKETGEPQKLYDLDLLVEPTPIEEIKLNLQGVPFSEILAIRNGQTTLDSAVDEVEEVEVEKPKKAALSTKGKDGMDF